MIAAALLCLGVLDLALATLSQRVHARLSADVLAELRAALFARCIDGPLDAVESFRQGDLLTRFGTDVPRIQSLLVDGILGGIQNVLFLGVAAAITFTLSPTLALWSFLGLALALLATTAFRRGVEQRTHRVREAMADLSHFLSERLSALRAIRIHRSQREEQARLAGANARLNHEVVGFQVFDAVATGAPGLLLTLALAWIYVVGGTLLEAGTISLGTFVAFVLYQGRLFGPAQGLLGLVRNLQAARVSLVARGRGARAGRHRAPTDRAGIGTRVRRRRHRADERRVCLRRKAAGFRSNVNLRVRRGERVALFGASGAGKSTLVELLFGLRQPAAGTVRIDGRPAYDRDPASVRQRPRLRRRRAVPAARDGRGESALWQSGGTTRGYRACGRACRCARLHCRAARRLRDGDRRPRPRALGRAASAARARPAVSCPIRGSSCSTRHFPPSISTPRRACARTSGRHSPIAPRSSFRTARSASRSSIASCSCTTDGSPRSRRRSCGYFSTPIRTGPHGRWRGSGDAGAAHRGRRHRRERVALARPRRGCRLPRSPAARRSHRARTATSAIP